MKKMVFFVLLLAFSRVGVALGMGPTPVGIGNFFLGSPSITESNLNQVLGLLVGPSGTPGVAGVSGANGKDGLNGIPGMPGINGVNGQDGAPGTAGAQGVAGPAGRDGINGAPGAQGIQGVAGPAGPAGPAGSGGSAGLLAVGGGNVSLGTCDDNVTITAKQSFQGTHFDLSEITVSGIIGITGSSNGCAGQDVTIHVKAADVAKECTLRLPTDIAGTSNRITFTTSSCGGVLSRINMKDLDTNIGLEFTEHGVS